MGTKHRPLLQGLEGIRQVTEEKVNDSTIRLTLGFSDVLHETDIQDRVIDIFNTLPCVMSVQLRYDESNKQVEVFRPGYKDIVCQLREFTWRHNVRLQKEGD